MPEIPGLDVGELTGSRFACIPECGFCCTFQPEVSKREAQALRARVQPLLLAHGPEGRSYLQLQGACGACTLLSAGKQCTAYEDRPAHCRYFPFHVYFGQHPEVYLNYSCRGVARDAEGDLTQAFRQSVLAVAPAQEIESHLAQATSAHAEFRRRARRAGAWEDPEPRVAQAAADAHGLLSGKAGRAYLQAAGFSKLSLEDAFEEALQAFSPQRSPEQRPYYLDPQLRWLTFEHEGEGALRALTLSVGGSLEPAGEVRVQLTPETPDALAQALAPRFQALLARGVFTGSAFDLVDAAKYERSVAQAVAQRALETAMDLVLRARIVAGLGFGQPDAATLADEAARFYDTEFLDAPTIGGFL